MFSGGIEMNLHTFYLNPFLTNVFFLYTLKTSENQIFSDVFRGYRSGSIYYGIQFVNRNILSK